jgi:hypothetical protein
MAEIVTYLIMGLSGSQNMIGRLTPGKHSYCCASEVGKYPSKFADKHNP